METIAVYWEETIRTYGFNLLGEQMLYQIGLPVRDAARWGGALQHLDEQAALFRLVWAQSERPDRITIYLLCDDTQRNKVKLWLDGHASAQVMDESWTRTQVDMIYFQGPHFGDRYGIMDFTLKALAKSQVPILGSVCSVASIFLIFPVGWGSEAKAVLTGAFEIPKEKRDVGGLSV